MVHNRNASQLSIKVINSHGPTSMGSERKGEEQAEGRKEGEGRESLLRMTVPFQLAAAAW